MRAWNRQEIYIHTYITNRVWRIWRKTEFGRPRHEWRSNTKTD